MAVPLAYNVRNLIVRRWTTLFHGRYLPDINLFHHRREGRTRASR